MTRPRGPIPVADVTAIADCITNGGPPPGWERDAECRGLTRLMYPERGEDQESPRATCDRCPVRTQCATASLLQHETFGVWGGYGERRRRRLMGHVRAELAARDPELVAVLEQPRRAQVAACGTDAAYFRHLRSTPRTDPCAACRAAHNTAEKDRIARRARRAGLDIDAVWGEVAARGSRIA